MIVMIPLLKYSEALRNVSVTSHSSIYTLQNCWNHCTQTIMYLWR